MKFNCGRTREEKQAEYIRHHFNWHYKFAWWPVQVDKHDCRWLEFVERRQYWICGGEAASIEQVIYNFACSICGIEGVGEFECASAGTNLQRRPLTYLNNWDGLL